MQDISNLLEQIKQQYVAEIPSRIDALESLILQLENTDQFKSTFEELYRTVHSLKGSAGMHNLHILGTVSHHFENRITQIGDDKSASTDQINSLLRFTDLLRQATEQIINNENEFSAVEKKLAKLSATNEQKNIKILVVETSKTIINIAEEIFSEYPAKLSLYRNGYDALKVLLIEHHDLLITNTEAPVLNGIALIAALNHSQDLKRHTYSMLLTSKEKGTPSSRHSNSDYTVLKNKHFIENFSSTAKQAIDDIKSQHKINK
ncbi:MAG: hypothetical protein GXP13_01530 [Gammaproteobacteria bacterium]|nr:hypothetical protein [Gammaproteobacteria bacterium]